MRKLCIIFLLLSCLVSEQLFPQKIYNTWFFGYHTGLDFNTSPPTPLNNPLIAADKPPYYISSICDSTGKLLFYTDGLRVWNASNHEITKLAGKWPWLDDMVLPLICPYPANDSLYYLFTVGKGSSINSGKLLFLSINMAHDTGEIVYPVPSTIDNYYTVLTDNVSFVLAGTTHCNQRDMWIATIGNGALNCFLVSPGGVSSTPITTTLPISQSTLEAGYSTIKFSANGEKLVIPIVSKNEILVYDFNNQTGVISNPILLHLPPNELLEDVELSPMGSKLYYASYVNQMDGNQFTGIEFHNIFQLDLELGSATEIENNRYQVNPFPDNGGCAFSCYIIHRTLVLGPDGRIYVSLRDAGNLDKRITVIEFPDKDKANANYRGGILKVDNVYKFMNVSYIRSTSFSPKENGIQVKKKSCLGQATEFSLFYTKIDSVKWDFGDPASGVNNFSTSITPIHNYTSVTLYTVKAIIYKACHSDTATTQISIEPDPIVQLPAYVKDTSICIGNKLQIDVSTPAAMGYEWSDGTTRPFKEIDKPGFYLIRAYNACSDDQKSFIVKFEACPCDVFVPNAFTPNNDGLNDHFKPIAKCVAKDYRFKIFDRYGQIVFETNNLNEGWNGKYKNNLSPIGVYVWILEYRNPNNHQVIRTHGTVALIR